MGLSKHYQNLIPENKFKGAVMPSCIVPNAALSPSQIMRLYSRGEIAPLGGYIDEVNPVPRPAHTDPLAALSAAQDFNRTVAEFVVNPPEVTQSEPPAQSPNPATLTPPPAPPAGVNATV